MEFSNVRLGLCLGFAVCLGLTTANAQTGGAFTDDFSSHRLALGEGAEETAWSILDGKFSVDGSDAAGNLRPTAGQLNFGREPGTAIALELAKSDAESFRGVSFLLRQSNGAQGGNHLFSVTFEDTELAGGTYTAKMSLNPAYFGTSGFAGYAYRSLEKIGLAGEALQMESSKFQKVTMKFDPSVGVTVALNGLDVLEMPNLFDLMEIDRVIFRNETGAVSWFVDDVTVVREEEF